MTIPAYCKRIGYRAFSGCVIRNVVIPDSVQVVDEMAFYSCPRLANVELPASLTFIGERAFSYCDDLSTVKVHFTEPIKITRETFFFTRPERKLTLIVPAGASNKFKNAEGWKLFERIIEDDTL